MSQTALVTGGTGFIALYVVKLLLEHGHHVHTTVRSLANKKKCKSLLELQTQYPDKLTLFEADLLSHGSFFQAMQGCDTKMVSRAASNQLWMVLAMFSSP
jgi:dihydroflavonol-4-reductase